MHNFFGKYSHVGVPPFSHHTPTHTPLIPQTPYTPISVAPSLVSTHIYLGSLTFSLRPDKVASVWRQWNLVFNKCEQLLCFTNQGECISATVTSLTASAWSLQLTHPDPVWITFGPLSGLLCGMSTFFVIARFSTLGTVGSSITALSCCVSMLTALSLLLSALHPSLLLCCTYGP